ncbi:cell division protein FtsQ [Candidatus Magnetoovum chiemensis]|nr:cell division protein FtsQ [Candidatus Magnetoovum chiemensis]
MEKLKKIDKKRKKQKSAKINFKKLKLPLKVLVFAALAAVIVLTAKGAVSAFLNDDLFKIKKLAVSGNKFLSVKDVHSLIDIKDKNILLIDQFALSTSLMQSPWIKDVQIRRDFPDTLLIRMNEAKPVALLNEQKKVFFLIDEKGVKLSQVEASKYKLPVIKINPDNKNAYMEGINLAKAINNNPTMSGTNVIINATKPEDITMEIADTKVLVGSGDYNRKLENYLDLKDEILKREITVEYIDVRFANRIIVKPLEKET